MSEERTFPLDDTDYYAKDVRMFHIGRASGVINATGKDFDTVPVGGMKTSVHEGYAYLKTGTQELGGVVYSNRSAMVITHDPADPILDRIDTIVIKFDRITNSCKLINVKGTNASSPVGHKPVRDANTYELVLKYVRVRHGVSAITDRDITDAILDEKVCGLAVDTLAKIPTGQYDRQIRDWKIKNEADYQNWSTAQKQEFDSWSEAQKQEFMEWFNSLKVFLDGDIATKLQSQILDNVQKINEINRKLEKAIFFK